MPAERWAQRGWEAAVNRVDTGILIDAIIRSMSSSDSSHTPWPPKGPRIMYERDLPQQLEFDFTEPGGTDIEVPVKQD